VSVNSCMDYRPAKVARARLRKQCMVKAKTRDMQLTRLTLGVRNQEGNPLPWVFVLRSFFEYSHLWALYFILLLGPASVKKIKHTGYLRLPAQDAYRSES